MRFQVVQFFILENLENLKRNATSDSKFMTKVATFWSV